MNKKPRTSAHVRLMKHVHIDESGCWLWTAYVSQWGYGRISDETGRLMQAHRVSYEKHIGPIPGGLSVLHRCDVPACVNPDHLFLGTHVDNMRDMIQKGRQVVLKGSAKSTAKLNEKAVREIRESRGITVSELSRTYGVSRRAIGFVLRGVTWN